MRKNTCYCSTVGSTVDKRRAHRCRIKDIRPRVNTVHDISTVSGIVTHVCDKLSEASNSE